MLCAAGNCAKGTLSRRDWLGHNSVCCAFGYVTKRNRVFFFQSPNVDQGLVRPLLMRTC
jgi:hypothetical protein